MNTSGRTQMRTLDAIALNGSPCYRTIITVDVEGSTTKLNAAKAHLREVMYDLFESALLTAGITEQFHDPLVDRGDGILALVYPQDEIPKTTILDTVVPSLGNLLTAHAAKFPNEQLRMRVAVHAGEVHYDGKGCYGEALDLTFRLLDAHMVKNELKQTATPLVLVVSDYIYQSIIRHGYDNIDKAAYNTTLTVRVAGQRHRGWLQTLCMANDDLSGNHQPCTGDSRTADCVPFPPAVTLARPRFEPRLA